MTVQYTTQRPNFNPLCETRVSVKGQGQIPKAAGMDCEICVKPGFVKYCCCNCWFVNLSQTGSYQDNVNGHLGRYQIFDWSRFVMAPDSGDRAWFATSFTGPARVYSGRLIRCHWRGYEYIPTPPAFNDGVWGMDFYKIDDDYLLQVSFSGNGVNGPGASFYAAGKDYQNSAINGCSKITLQKMVDNFSKNAGWQSVVDVTAMSCPFIASTPGVNGTLPQTYPAFQTYCK